jgi:lipoyl(octanoyl) transferase
LSSCLAVDLGLIPYGEAWELQKRVAEARKAGAIGDVLLLCEHPHVITLGRNARREHVLVSENVLRQMNVEFFQTNRGGDVTYHGPGQIVGYPVLNLGAIRRDVVWYVRALEELLIRTTAEFGVAGGREAGKTGVWATKEEPPRRGPLELRLTEGSKKLAAIGVHISRWVTTHGFAYNVSPDLRYFDLIVPCGIPDRRPTSLEKLLGRTVSRAEVLPCVVRHFGEVFGLEMRESTVDAPWSLLERAHPSTAICA